MKIYGHFFSAPSNKVRFCANALGLEYDYIHVDLPSGEQGQPDFLAVNPRGKVPAINDEGYCLAESEAICRYLARKSGKLYPEQDIETCGKVDHWMDVSAQYVLLHMSKILFNRFFAPMLQIEPHQASIDDGQRNLDMILPFMDQHLAESDFLAGTEMTLADISMLASTDPFDMIGVSLDKVTNVKRWRDNLMSQDFYQQVHSLFGAEAQQG